MAHLIETMAYAGQKPWHSLGQQLAPNKPIEDWQQAAGMNWQIEASPVRFFNGSETLHTFPEQHVLHRSDTHAPLAVVSSRYQVVQPREILEFYRDLTEVSGFALETAGVLKGGKKFWALARTGQSVTLKGSDQINGYLLLATACDGTLATTAQFTSVRVVCNNTLHIALGDSDGAVKVSHRSTFDAESVKRQLGIAVSSWDGFMVRMKALSERRITETQASAYLRNLLATPASPIPSEKALKSVLALYEGNGLGSAYASSKGTAWGLLNAVTQWTDHERRARSDDHRKDSAWFGPGSTLKQQAWKEALQFVS